MIRPPGYVVTQPSILETRAAKRTVAIALALIGVVAATPVRADETPSSKPLILAPKVTPQIAPNPREIMATMARELDKHPDDGVFVLEKTTITQGEVADYIRSMPVAMAGLGYAEVFRRAVDTMVAQKAMMLNALKDGLDKDPGVIRRTKALREKALADAWLVRRSDAAVTDQALKERYDRDVAGKPGPYEVRARLIVVPTEAEALTVIDKAQKGADFGELARTYSKDGSAAKGGDLGYASLEAMNPEIGIVAFALPLGQFTTFPMRTASGYFVLRVEGRQQRGTPTFEEARPGLEAALRSEAIGNAIQDVLSHIKIAPVAKPSGAPK